MSGLMPSTEPKPGAPASISAGLGMLPRPHRFTLVELGHEFRLTDGFLVAYRDIGKVREQERQALLYPSCS